MKSNIKGFFKASRSKEELSIEKEKMDPSFIRVADIIQFTVTVQHFKFMFDRFESRHICNNPENTIILDDEDIAYFKNKYKDQLQKELDEEIYNLKKQYEICSINLNLEENADKEDL